MDEKSNEQLLCQWCGDYHPWMVNDPSFPIQVCNECYNIIIIIDEVVFVEIDE